MSDNVTKMHPSGKKGMGQSWMLLAGIVLAAAIVAAVVVTSVIVLVGTTGRLFVGGTIVPARLLVGGAAPAGVIERHMRCSSQQCLSLNGVSAGLRRTLLKTPELNLSF